MIIMAMNDLQELKKNDDDDDDMSLCKGQLVERKPSLECFDARCLHNTLRDLIVQSDRFNEKGISMLLVKGLDFDKS